jgi:hypothetical protein
VRRPCQLAPPTLLRVDSGVPNTSKRAGSRTGGGGGVVKPPKTGTPKTGVSKSAATKSNGASKSNGAARQGPVDPRTEDPSSPNGLSRAGKTIWRRPGALTPHTAKHRESGSLDQPIEFSLALPLAPAPTELVDAASPDTISDAAIETEPIALPPTIESLQPSTLTPTPIPTGFVPTAPIPTEQPTEAVPVPILYDEAATIDDVTKIGPVLDSRPLRRPVTFRRAPKPRVRRVTRVVRHVDTWSVFKVALVFNVFFYAVALVAGVLLWQVAYATGTVDNVEKFFEGFGWETFKFNGGQIFHNAWIAGLFIAVGLTGLAVLLATLFNLITDLVGGVRLSVLEEEVQERAERGIEEIRYELTPAVVDDPEPVDDSVAETTVSQSWLSRLRPKRLPVESDGRRPVA